MNISITHTTMKKVLVSIGAFVFTAIFSVGLIQTPARALSLDLPKTLAPLMNYVPFTNNVIPVLTPLPVPAVTPTPPAQQPAESPLVVAHPSVTDPQTSSTSNANSVPQQNRTIASVDPPANGFASSFTTSQSPNGLSTLAKQSQILEAPAHVPSPALMYGTNQISAKLANIVFVIGVAGILAGGCVIYATRPKIREGITR